jgi:hypothetical protein
MGLQHKLETSGKLLPAGVATPRTVLATADGILICYGITVPSDAATGYSPGCLFLHTDGTAGSELYINSGTAASADFDLVTVA